MGVVVVELRLGMLPRACVYGQEGQVYGGGLMQVRMQRRLSVGRIAGQGLQLLLARELRLRHQNLQDYDHHEHYHHEHYHHEHDHHEHDHHEHYHHEHYFGSNL